LHRSGCKEYNARICTTCKKCMRMQDVLPPPYTWPVPEKIGVKSVNEDRKSVARDFSATRNSNALE
jgi:hypothetical protein